MFVKVHPLCIPGACIRLQTCVALFLTASCWAPCSLIISTNETCITSCIFEFHYIIRWCIKLHVCGATLLLLLLAYLAAASVVLQCPGMELIIFVVDGMSLAQVPASV